MAQSELLVEVVRIQKNPKIAEVTDGEWSFIRIPREEIENSKPLPLEKLKSSGIYFLIGIDWGAHCFKFCVGEAPRSDELPFSEQGNKCFLKRIDADNLAQRWWENIFFLSSLRNGEFNDADLHYLETRFRDQNEPTPGVHLGKERKEVLDRIIREITLFMNIMGWNISNTPQPPPSTPSNTFRLDEKTAKQYGVEAARFEIPVIKARKSKTIVREGSPIALPEKNIERMRKTNERRQKWFAEHPDQDRLNEKEEFDNPTDAVQFVTGDHMRVPPVMVRVTDNKTLAEIIKPLQDAQKRAKGKESLS